MPNRIPICLAQIACNQVPVCAAENTHPSDRLLLANRFLNRGFRNPNTAWILLKHDIIQLREDRAVPEKLVAIPCEALSNKSSLPLPCVDESGPIMQQ